MCQALGYKDFLCLASFNLHTAQTVECYYYSHFIDGKTEAQNHTHNHTASKSQSWDLNQVCLTQSLQLLGHFAITALSTYGLHPRHSCQTQPFLTIHASLRPIQGHSLLCPPSHPLQKMGMLSIPPPSTLQSQGI